MDSFKKACETKKNVGPPTKKKRLDSDCEIEEGQNVTGATRQVSLEESMSRATKPKKLTKEAFDLAIMEYIRDGILALGHVETSHFIKLMNTLVPGNIIYGTCYIFKNK